MQNPEQIPNTWNLKCEVSIHIIYTYRHPPRVLSSAINALAKLRRIRAEPLRFLGPCQILQWAEIAVSSRLAVALGGRLEDRAPLEAIPALRDSRIERRPRSDAKQPSLEGLRLLISKSNGDRQLAIAFFLFAVAFRLCLF